MCSSASRPEVSHRVTAQLSQTVQPDVRHSHPLAKSEEIQKTDIGQCSLAYCQHTPLDVPPMILKPKDPDDR